MEINKNKTLFESLRECTNLKEANECMDRFGVARPWVPPSPLPTLSIRGRVTAYFRGKEKPASPPPPAPEPDVYERLRSHLKYSKPQDIAKFRQEVSSAVSHLKRIEGCPADTKKTVDSIMEGVYSRIVRTHNRFESPDELSALLSKLPQESQVTLHQSIANSDFPSDSLLRELNSLNADEAEKLSVLEALAAFAETAPLSSKISISNYSEKEMGLALIPILKEIPVDDRMWVAFLMKGIIQGKIEKMLQEFIKNKNLADADKEKLQEAIDRKFTNKQIIKLMSELIKRYPHLDLSRVVNVAKMRNYDKKAALEKDLLKLLPIIRQASRDANHSFKTSPLKIEDFSFSTPDGDLEEALEALYGDMQYVLFPSELEKFQNEIKKIAKGIPNPGSVNLDPNNFPLLLGEDAAKANPISTELLNWIRDHSMDSKYALTPNELKHFKQAVTDILAQFKNPDHIDCDVIFFMSKLLAAYEGVKITPEEFKEMVSDKMMMLMIEERRKLTENETR